jgi:hypothetical protein
MGRVTFYVVLPEQRPPKLSCFIRANDKQGGTPYRTTTIFINSKNMTMPIKAKNTYLQAVLPEQHKEQLKKIAAKEGRSLSSLVAFIVAQWLEQRAKRQ